MKIVLLDLYCCAGGASMGYYRAALKLGYKIHITGIDKDPQPNYPFKFIRADAIKYLQKNGHKFTHIHASPPCQQYSKSTAFARSKGIIYPDLMAETQKLMYQLGKPGIIENVMQAPNRKDIVLRGDMFGLKVIRKRKFELVNWFMLQPYFPKLIGTVKDGDFVSVFGDCGIKVKKGGKRLKGFEDKTIKESWKYAMQMDWVKKSNELAQAIPPAYTEYLGEFFFNTAPGGPR